MELKQGLRLAEDICVALVGAGGKTAALFQLAREYERGVLLATTTHLARGQVALADHHFPVWDASQIPDWQASLAGKTLLFTGSKVPGEDRVGSVDSEALAAIKALADQQGVPLLIEADGARQLPLKAPADHEPPIPAFVDAVIVVAGLSGVGKPLTGKTVHRPEIFGELAGLDRGETITAAHLQRVLFSRRGGLKNVPGRARRILLLNQADAYTAGGDLDALAISSLEAYHAVAVAALGKGMVQAVHEPTAGIVLAAGGSSRYGKSKQLLPWKGRPLVAHAAETALEAGLNPVMVVTGADREQVGDAVADLAVQVVHNPDWKEGQSTSVRVGAANLPSGTGSAVFCLADQPQIPPKLIRALRAKHAETHAPIVATQVKGQRANPVLFDCRLFEALQDLEGDVGGRALFDRYDPHFVPWEDPGVKFDVDTPEDYQQLLEHNQGDDVGDRQR